MKNSYLALICGILLFVVLSMAWCQPRSTSTSSTTPSPIVSPPTPPTLTAAPALSPAPSAAPSASPTEAASAELRNAARKAAPAVVLVSVFDASGNLLRTGAGFFVSDDGKLVANRHLVEDGVNAIAKTADDKIYNVAGVLAESTELDIALLQAETKRVPSLPLNKVATPESGARVAIVESPLAHREALETKIAAGRSDDKGEWLDLTTLISNAASGLPVVNENGVLVGIISSDRAKNPPSNSVLSSNALQSFLEKIEPGATAGWAASQVSPSPSASTSPVVRRRIVFNPPPAFPSEARGTKSVATSDGSYRIYFDATGRAKNVQILKSTGAPAFDRAAVTALQQWKSEPGQEWTIVVPVSFQTKGARN
jgi:TonB family protein